MRILAFLLAVGSAQSPVAFPVNSRHRQRRLAHWKIICLLASAFCLSARGQYSIEWQTLDGGGGTSTGGVYSVTGTIGQPDAGAMSGGNFTLQGGFWSVIVAVQTPGAPLLTITLNPQLSTINVSWPSPSTGWTLQQNSNLATTSWSTSGGISDNGTNKSITITSPTGNLFFRLKPQ